MPFGPEMEAAITALGVVQGELPNVLDAAINDVAENILDGVMEAWPVYGGPQPPSRRAQAKVPKRKASKPHSKTLWRVLKPEKLKISIVNTAEYASYVHLAGDKGGPPGLADRLMEAAITAAQNDPLDFVSERIAALLGLPADEAAALEAGGAA
jgi:hypothetical protein